MTSFDRQVLTSSSLRFFTLSSMDVILANIALFSVREVCAAVDTLKNNTLRLIPRKCDARIFIHEFSKVLPRVSKNLYKALSVLLLVYYVYNEN